MKRKSFLLSLALMMVLSVFLAACGPNNADKGDDGAAAGDPVEGGKVTLAMFSAPKGLFNPIFYEDQYDVYVLNYSFEPLFVRDEKLNLTPNLAKEWKFSDDAKELTITLEDGVKWHDGEAVTVDDMIFAWETIADKDYTGPRFSDVASIVGAEEKNKGKAETISGIEKIDDLNVKVTFKDPAANHLDKLWGFPIPEHLYKDIPIKEMPNADVTMKKPIGNGPFKISEIKPNEYVVLDKNADYFKGKPYLDQIVWKVIAQDVALGALQNGEIDFLPQIAPKEFDTLSKDDSLTIKETQDFGYQYMGFNLTKEKLQDKKLRQAMVYAIDRQGIVDGLLKGHGSLLNQHIPQASWAYNESLKDAYPYDPEKAKNILKEAGYVDKDGDGFVEDPKGNKLKLKLSYPTGNPVREQSAQPITENLRAVGLDVKLDQPAEVAVYYDNVEQSKYELFLAGWGLTPDPDPSGIWLSTDQWNFSRWDSKESDKLIKSAVTAKDAIQDQNKRKEYYAKWTELVSDESPYAFLYSQNTIEAWNKRVQGVTFDWRGAIQHPDVYKWWVSEDK
ncbi:peptide-binding protein [Mechercharimyces sp. CAU 1602]|uniref:peptide-binding protein n=1 Tax=Mechercharimyces sp. CAU 1602 TaxID=2973933 RepID=UPI00216292D6|nr:peptide-binding protein [Mechercharimyces sp. CAU 1602]MCS1350660.1 peptide-binding protein [Mechercharimyces sp. CAU 1602]